MVDIDKLLMQSNAQIRDNKTALQKVFSKENINQVLGITPNKNLMSFAMPVSIGGGAGLATRAVGGIKTGVSSIWRALTTAKLPSPRAWLGASAGLVGMHTAFKAAKSSITKEPFNPIPTKQDLLRSAAGGLAPSAAVVGVSTGLLEVLGKKAYKAAVDPRFPWEKSSMIPNLPMSSMSNETFSPEAAYKNLLREINDSNIGGSFPSFPSSNIVLNMPSAMPSMVLPSTSVTMPSISVGGMGGGLDLAMLAALLGGTGGFLLGRRRKRKKKKYKKRRRR